MRATVTTVVMGLLIMAYGFAGGVAGDILAEVSPSNILVNPSFEEGSGDFAVAWESVKKAGNPQCFVAGPDKAHSGNRCVAVRGNSAGPGTVNGWYLSGSTVELCNPAGNGTTEGMVVEAGENYLRIKDDPSLGSDQTFADQWLEDMTIKPYHTYTLRFSYGKSSDPNKTWTRMGVYLAGCPTSGSWTGAVNFSNPTNIYWSGDPGWGTYEYSETIQPGDPRVGMYLGLKLTGYTLNTTDAYYFDEVRIEDTSPGEYACPPSITYQGELTNAQGQAIVDATHNFVFKFYTQESGGQPNWTSLPIPITPSDGIFTAQIDLPFQTETAIPDGGVWMEVVVDSETLSPRINISSVPLAVITGRIAEVAMLTANPASGANLVVNGGFEDPPITDGGNDGSEYGIWYTDEVYLIKYAIYRISGWVKTEGDATGDLLLSSCGYINFGATPQWTQFEKVFSAGATGRERLVLEGYGKGTIFFDDISIQMIYGPWVGGSASITTDGAPLVGIVLPDSSNMTEIYLAMETRRVLKAMTGVDLPIVKKSTVVPDSNRRIYIGRATDTTLYTTDLAAVGDEGIVLDITPQAVVCLGNTPRGVYYAVQELFYTLGCRWYTPWDGGEVIPHSTTLSLPTGKIVRDPSFKLRGSKVVHTYRYPDGSVGWFDIERWIDWAARNRMNGLTVGSMKFMSYGEIRGYDYQDFSGHTIHAILGLGGRTLAKYPLYYPLVDGVRTDTTPWGARPSNICVSNQDVIDYFADFANEYFDKYPYAERLMIDQEDVGAWCEDANCKALDPPGVDWSKKQSTDWVFYGMSDRWMWFINRIAERVAAKHPGKFIGTFAYADTAIPPVNAANNPRSNVMIEQTWSWTVNWPIPYGPWESVRCWKHNLGDPTCPYSTNGLNMFNLWSGLAPISIYSYYQCYNTHYLPESYCHADADFYRTMYARGVRRVSDEWDTDVLAAPLLLNLRMRLLWDKDVNVDQYIDDFCTKVYGVAAVPVKQYFQAVEQVITGSPNTHVVYLDNLLTLAKCTELESYLTQAETDAGSDTTLLGRIARLRISVYYARIILNDPNSQAVKAAANALINQYSIPIQYGNYVF